MRRLCLLLSISLLTAWSPYDLAYAQGNPPSRQPPPPYAGGPRSTNGGQANNSENCGTPDEPKPCPPMPRVPLQYYPANRP